MNNLLRTCCFSTDLYLVGKMLNIYIWIHKTGRSTTRARPTVFCETPRRKRVHEALVLKRKKATVTQFEAHTTIATMNIGTGRCLTSGEAGITISYTCGVDGLKGCETTTKFLGTSAVIHCDYCKVLV